MKSLETRYREREELKIQAERNERIRTATDVALAIELQNHVERFCSAQGFQITTECTGGKLTILKHTGEEMICSASSSEGNFFVIQAVNIGPASLDEDGTLDAILDWL